MASLVQAMGGADTFRSVGLVSRYLILNIKVNLQRSPGHVLLGRFPRESTNKYIQPREFYFVLFQDMGDEPGFRECLSKLSDLLLTCSVPTYLYNYVGQPVKTVDRVDATLAQYYNTR